MTEESKQLNSTQFEIKYFSSTPKDAQLAVWGNIVTFYCWVQRADVVGRCCSLCNARCVSSLAAPPPTNFTVHPYITTTAAAATTATTTTTTIIVTCSNAINNRP